MNPEYCRVMNDAAKRGCLWLAEMQRSDGSFGALATTIDAYYKSPLAFAEGGLDHQGNLALRWIDRNLLTKEGHLGHNAGPSGRYCDLYEDLWLAWGAFRLSEFGLVDRVWEFALRFFDQRCGAFRSTISSSDPAWYDLRSTSLGGLVALTLRQVDVARAAGHFVLNLLDMQPALLDRVFLVYCEGSLVTDFPPALARYFVVSRMQQNPLYYALSLGIVFLAELFRSTGRREYLIGAERLALAIEAHGRTICFNQYSAKAAWAFSALYRLTGKTEYGQLALEAASHIVANQFVEGCWGAPELFSRRELEPIRVSLDRSAEYSSLLRFVSRDMIDPRQRC
jgi:hypothetical protein